MTWCAQFEVNSGGNEHEKHTVLGRHGDRSDGRGVLLAAGSRRPVQFPFPTKTIVSLFGR
jgi:hypothetical protein